MKSIYLLMAVLLISYNGIAQSDSASNNKGDTVRVGNFVIIKKNNSDDTTRKNKDVTVNVHINTNDEEEDNNYEEHVHVHHRNLSTNYLIFDLGFANWNDKTDYGSDKANEYLITAPGEEPFTKNDLKISAGKSSNVNIWLFMQKLNVSKHMLNIKYGLGLEMYNFRYTHNITYSDNPPSIYRDTIDFSKNKLYVGYATIPFMINFDANPEKKHSFSLSAGVSAGYKIGSKNKQVSDERSKEKLRGDFDLNQWRFAYVAEAGLGPVRLYGSYSINPLHQSGLQQYPYAIGIRFSNW